MKSTLRSTAAAATMLLASLGAMTVATPASAQYRAVPQAAVQPRVQVEQFAVLGAFDGNGEVRFRVLATPRASVMVDVPGVTRQALAEARPGVYEGRYLRRGRTDPRAFERATATVEIAGQRVVAKADMRGDRERHGRDNDAPRISELTPSQGERVSERGWTRIAARVDDRGTGVDTVSLRVDSRDVSERVRLEGDQVRYAEDLPEGRHEAELVVRDRAGNTTRQAWSFEVVDRDHGHGRGRDHGHENDR